MKDSEYLIKKIKIMQAIKAFKADAKELNKSIEKISVIWDLKVGEARPDEKRGGDND